VSAHGKVQADLRIGANVGLSLSLHANQNLSNRGVQLIGSGFIVESKDLPSLGLDIGNSSVSVVRKYLNGKDIPSELVAFW
jgi:hypothetical protein